MSSHPHPDHGVELRPLLGNSVVESIDSRRQSHVGSAELDDDNSLIPPIQSTQAEGSESLVPRPSVEATSPLLPQTSDFSDISPFAKISLLSKWVPEADPENTRAQKRNKWSDRDRAMSAHLCFTALVFTVNAIATIYLCVRYGTPRGIGSLYEGSCAKADSINTWLHLVINVLSTILLGSSNYCMQVLLAPTRNEVDEAHREHKWLDVGAPSYRNSKAIKGERRLLWFVLALSSAGLHLVWNAAVFKAIPIQSYTVATVTSDFRENLTPWRGLSQDLAVYVYPMQADLTNYERLDQEECVKRYINPLASGKRLVIVTKDTNSRNASHHKYEAFAGTSLIKGHRWPGPWWKWKEAAHWICKDNWVAHNISINEFCDWPQMQPYIGDWQTTWAGSITEWGKELTVADPDHGRSAPVDYCLSEGIESLGESCSVQFSAAVMSIVCFLNLLKVLCILYVIKKETRTRKNTQNKTKGGMNEEERIHEEKRKTLVTLGDAIASFLEFKDATTENRCLLDLHAVRHFDTAGEPRSWSPCHDRLLVVASRLRWIMTAAPYILVLVTAVALLILSYVNLRVAGVSVKRIYGSGLGAILSPEILGGPFQSIYDQGLWGFTVALLVANCPQVVVSALYLMLNSLLTCIWVTIEWSHFDKEERKTLRMTSPRGLHRSSYFLTLPYKIGFPLMLGAGLLHYFISQAVYPVRTRSISPDGANNHRFDSTVIGNSLLGITISFVLGVVFLLAYITTPLVRYKSDMPLAGTCSLAISAACHRDEDDTDAHLMPLKWGVISEDKDTGIGHACFSTMTDNARPDQGSEKGPGHPIEGGKYA